MFLNLLSSRLAPSSPSRRHRHRDGSRLLRWLAVACLTAMPAIAQAWWNPDWKNREQVVLDTSATGIAIQGPVTGVTVPVRLHIGNFAFADARPDGGDLRFVAADDKTPLAYTIERFDPDNELALVWVRVPTLAPGDAKQFVWLYHGNPEARSEGDARAVFGASVVFNFSSPDGQVRDDGSNGLTPASPVALDPVGLMGGSAVFDGAPLVLGPAPALERLAGASWSLSAWLRAAPGDGPATLFQQGPLKLATDAGQLVVSIDDAEVARGGMLVPDQWQQLTLNVGDTRTAVMLDGAEVAAVAQPLPALLGELRIGEGFHGRIDALQLANAPRSADWLALTVRGQGIDSGFAQVLPEPAESDDAGGVSYFGILFANLTTDAWVVIMILAVMFVIAAGVMVDKARFIGRSDRANRRFLSQFRAAHDDFLNIAGEPGFAHSSLHRLYTAGVRELNKREVGHGAAGRVLSGASIDAVKAAIDADLVRESHRLNAKMVLLTIAISGGPFLGLLGTVVGVMITFAAIAAAGDVNVNAIAPGIAAALLATVAGLAVAIPALFGYNYLASRIKNIGADMQIFVDEFVTRVAEQHGGA